MRISDWSSDVCSSDLKARILGQCLVKALGRFFGENPVEIPGKFRRIANQPFRPDGNRISVHGSRKRHTVAIEYVGAPWHQTGGTMSPQPAPPIGRAASREKGCAIECR